MGADDTSFSGVDAPRTHTDGGVDTSHAAPSTVTLYAPVVALHETPTAGGTDAPWAARVNTASSSRLVAPRHAISTNSRSHSVLLFNAERQRRRASWATSARARCFTWSQL